MKIKYSLTLVLLLFLMLSVNAQSQPDPQIIMLDGINFDIPWGFSKNNTLDGNYTFMDDYNETFTISITQADDDNLTEFKGNRTIINNVFGVEDYSNGNYTFTYVIKNKLIEISSDDEDILKSVIYDNQ